MWFMLSVESYFWVSLRSKCFQARKLERTNSRENVCYVGKFKVSKNLLTADFESSSVLKETRFPLRSQIAPNK